MAKFDGEFFGTPERIAAMRRVANLWTVLQASPDYRSYGRAIGLNGLVDQADEKMAALARITGVGICYYCPKKKAGPLFAALESRGLLSDRHEQYMGGEGAYQKARQILESATLPEDLKMIRLGPETSPRLIEDVAALCNAEGVIAVPGAIMRGVAIPGVVFVAVDGLGAPVASASSHAMLAPHHPRGNEVFWGALTTRPDRRGEGIALVLGARAIVHMWENEGARGFLTGVRQANTSSQNLCAKLAVHDTEWIMAQAIDAEVLGTTKHTS